MNSQLSLSPEDDAAIRAIVQRMMAGWNAGDADEFAAPFAEDADYVIVNGQHIQGRVAIREGHRQIFDTVYRGSHNTLTVEQIRLLRPDVALLHAAAHLVFRVAETEREARARFSMVLLKDDDRWQTVAFQNTPQEG